MSATKTNTVLANDVVVVPSTPQTFNSAALTTDYGGELLIKVTNGATGPTVPLTVGVNFSHDNFSTVYVAYVLVAATGNAAVTVWQLSYDTGAQYIQTVVSGNTGQNVTFREEISRITAI